MFTELLITHLICLGLTILIEVSLAWGLGVRNMRDILIVLLAQIITNPIVVFVSSLFINNTNVPFLVYHIPLEIAVVLAEWQIYKKYANNVKNPFVLSLTTNAFSYSSGLLLQHFGFI